jgi:Rrf2 family cysteine metabolism transcriptional repressor
MTAYNNRYQLLRCQERIYHLLTEYLVLAITTNNPVGIKDIMKLTTKMRYATRAMLELALHESATEPVSLRDIANNEKISVKYLEVLLGALRSAGFIRSIRGAAGGYRLVKSPSEITLRQLYELFEGSDGFVACTFDKTICERNGDCAAQSVWSEMFLVTMDYLESITLADLVARDELLHQPTKLMYDI